MRKTKVPGTNRTQTVTRATPHATYVDSRRYSHSCLPGKCTSNESLITHNRRVFLKNTTLKKKTSPLMCYLMQVMCVHMSNAYQALSFPPRSLLEVSTGGHFLGSNFCLSHFVSSFFSFQSIFVSSDSGFFFRNFNICSSYITYVFRQDSTVQFPR